MPRNSFPLIESGGRLLSYRGFRDYGHKGATQQCLAIVSKPEVAISRNSFPLIESGGRCSDTENSQIKKPYGICTIGLESLLSAGSFILGPSILSDLTVTSSSLILCFIAFLRLTSVIVSTLSSAGEASIICTPADTITRKIPQISSIVRLIWFLIAFPLKICWVKYST